ncbi:MAG: DUF1345 domain-containing protein [Bacteroidia bacterium]
MKKHKHHWSEKIAGYKKLIVCSCLSILVYFLLTYFTFEFKNRIILSWDTYCILMLFFSWALFWSTDKNELPNIVSRQDNGLKSIFVLTLLTISVSLFGTIVLLMEKDSNETNKLIHAVISLSPMFLSWLLLHTTFAIRYAHLYHDHNKLQTGSNIGGIEFPNNEQPDYVDFAYFSFVIGMTFQVSDVIITSKVLRRFVLIHALISFGFNTMIVALTINSVSNVLNPH